MALKMQSCEMHFQEKPMVSTKWNSIALIAVTTMLIFGILFTPLYLYSSQMNEKFYSLKKDFKKIMNDIEELKMKKEILGSIHILRHLHCGNFRPPLPPLSPFLLHRVIY